jgi:hypothetical protein
MLMNVIPCSNGMGFSACLRPVEIHPSLDEKYKKSSKCRRHTVTENFSA